MKLRPLVPMQPSKVIAPIGLIYFLSFIRLILFQVQGEDGMESRILDSVIHETELVAPRGKLFDRNGMVLAEDRPAWRLVMDQPSKFRRHTNGKASPEEVETELKLLAEMLAQPANELASVLLDQKRIFAILKEDIKATEARHLRALLKTMPGSGLRLKRYWARVYPQGRSLSHLVGFLQDEGGKRQGKLGLEALCEDSLKGESGHKRSLSVRGAHGVNPTLGFDAPQVADGVVTTLDSRIGAYMRSELSNLSETHQVDWVACVVLNAKTGDLLAMGGLPDFNPNWPGDGLEQDKEGNWLGLAQPCFWPIEPGSTMKPFVVGRALAENAISTRDTFSNFGGRWKLGSRVIQNARGVPNEAMNASAILRYSSNIGAGQVGLKLGADGLKRAFDDFAFWKPLGLSLREPALGIQPSAERWKGAQGRIWTIPSVSMGHQMSVTPVRLAYGFASLVNGGLLHQPRIFASEQRQAPQRVLPASTSKYLRDALHSVVSTRSNWLPSWEGFSWGGKSGTTQKTHESGYTSLFVAYGPVEDPEVVVAVVSENPKGEHHYGSRVSAPSAGRILQHAVFLLNDEKGGSELDVAPLHGILSEER